MTIAQMNWRDIEAAAARDPRCILPIGSTEQHAQLSVCVDMILAERVATEAAAPLNIPVFPGDALRPCPLFQRFPRHDLSAGRNLDGRCARYHCFAQTGGFSQILIVNGHGGNNPVGALAQELMAEYGDVSIKFHNWWNAPQTWAKIQATDSTGSHANWMENFPWTRLAHAPAPDGEKPWSTWP